MRLVQLLCLAFAVSACAVGGPNIVYVTDQRYQPTASVERLRAFPDRPYVALAELDWMATGQTRREIEDRLAEEARQLGANAIVFGKTRTSLNNLNDTSGTSETKHQSAIAIRYR
jgi:hypothetical protein